MKAFGRHWSAAQFDADTTVQGERGPSAVSRTPSVQTLISNGLALGLVLAMGLGWLAWYYVHTSSRHSQARQSAQALSRNRAEGDTALPSLGPLALPQPVGPSSTLDPGAAATQPVRVSVLDSTLPLRTVQIDGAGAQASHDGAAARPSSLDRRLSGAAFVREAASSEGDPQRAVPSALSGATVIEPGSATGQQLPLPATRNASADGALATLLRADHGGGAAVAHVLPTQRLWLPKGAFIDCTLETAIDSTLPGMTTCVTATDTFGIDGKVVLLERGSKLVGETRGQVQQGSARVFVLWTEARTPTGVIVPLDSPAADELGRAGLAGTVERHFWERFGAALVISTIDGAVQAGVQSASRGNGAVIYNPSASQDVMTESLKSTVNIPPTVLKRNGDRIQVLVARDIDFTEVYELEHAHLEP